MTKTLADYAKHFDTCPRLGKARSHPAICTCGLDALLAGEGESRRENRLGIEGLRPLDPSIVREFERTMIEEVIPQTIKALHERELAWNRIKDMPLFAWTPEYQAAKHDELHMAERLRARGDAEAADRILSLRADFETEREMHNAWRKRAEEAEAQIGRVSSSLSEASPDTAQEQSAKDHTSDLVYSSELGYVLKAEAPVETVDQLRAAVIELSNRHIPQHRIKEALDRLILAAEARGRQTA